jgi:flagellar hook protein FlgE
VAQVSVARFENNQGLFKLGKNLFRESRESGMAAVGRPTEAGRGEILIRSLELSTVDLASEFVNLMTLSRNFKANTKVITTADDMIQEVLKLKS